MSQQPYIPRALEPVVKRYSEHFKAVVVTGPRQVGKTTMLKHLMEEEAERGIHRAYVTMDDTALRMAAVSDPALFLQRYEPPVLIDEIQKAPELLPYIKMALDESDENGLFWLTGSQPFHLMRHVSESLAGRVGVVEMLGLSNAEIAGVPSRPFVPGKEYFLERIALMKPFGVNEAFERIVAGSLPGIRGLPDDVRAAAYESYLETYVMRDIRDLGQVADELKFRRFMAACAALTARPVVYAELARLADIDEKTARAWLSLLTSSYLVKIVPPYANNLLKRLSKQPVMHFTDTGLAVYLAGWTNAKSLELGAMAGQIFETYAVGEVGKSFVNAGMRPSLYFLRTSAQKEIDIVIERDSTLYPVEIKKSASPSRRDVKNFATLAPVERAATAVDGKMSAGAAADAGADGSGVALRRTVGMGTELCMVADAYPIADNAWAFPVWAV